MNSYEVGCLISDVFNVFTPGSSIVAGGYLRDLDLGRSPKDVDVLIEYESNRDYDEVVIQANIWGYSVRDVDNGYCRSDARKDLRKILKLEKGGFLSIDIIFLNMPVLDRVAEFPCNLSQIYRNSRGEIVRCPAYVEGVRDHKVVYNTATLRTNYERKMKKYFPDWEHIIE